MTRTTWSDSAMADLRVIRTYFDEVAPAAAQVMIDRIVVAADWLHDFPGVGSPIGYRAWRKWRAHKTPYLVIYRPTRVGIEIVRIRHAREDWSIEP